MSEDKRAVYFFPTVLAGTILLGLVLFRLFPVVDLIAATQQWMTALGPWGAICYPFLFALFNLLLLPGGILCVGSGLFFGLWWGFILVFLGNAIGATVAFALTRVIAQRWFQAKFEKSHRFRSLEPAIEKEGWKVIFLTQLHPLFPTSLITYLYGLTRIPFKTYLTWISIGRAPGLFLYVYLGTLGQYGVNIARGKSHPRAIEYWVWGGTFVIVALLFIVAVRIAARAARYDSQREDVGYAGRNEVIPTQFK